MRRLFGSLLLMLALPLSPVNAVQEALYIDHESVSRVPSLFVPQQMKISPTGSHIGFIAEMQMNEEKGEWALIMNDTATGLMRILAHDPHLSRWEWDSDTTVSVRVGCGTGCMRIYRIDAETGQMLSDEEDEHHNCNALYVIGIDPFTNGYPNCLLSPDENISD
ncbi:hypothetical protein HY627_02170 [Candidatus Uhrbacteria bacterium]|nr:hypothetical protein [Candidatus Uhrbacteria bacterium]